MIFVTILAMRDELFFLVNVYFKLQRETVVTTAGFGSCSGLLGVCLKLMDDLHLVAQVVVVVGTLQVTLSFLFPFSLSLSLSFLRSLSYRDAGMLLIS